MFLHVIAPHKPMAYIDLCDSAVFMNDFTLCVRNFVTWFARNVLTEICEAYFESKIYQQLCRVVSA
jgi:hypothetical protein